MPRILVADDNSNIQKMVALAFQDHGIEVVSVGNGEAAVRRIPDLNPDVVLADVFMPVRNGYEVCEFIKKDSRFAKVPVILLVGAFDPLDESEARRVGADGILKKPFVPPDPLIAMVTSVMAKTPKPEPKAEAPDLEIPKLTAPPPQVIPQFPEPTPEEEAYAFGTGRRSLDDDEAAGGFGGGTKVAASPAASSTTATTSDEDAALAETGADWRRRDQVDSASVPSFSPALIEEPAETTPAPSESPALAETEMNSLALDSAVHDSPVLTEEPAPAATPAENFVRAFKGAFGAPSAKPEDVHVRAFGEPLRRTEVEPPPTTPAGASELERDDLLEDEVRSSKSLSDLMAPALANPSDWAVKAPSEAVLPVVTEPAPTQTTVPETSAESVPVAPSVVETLASSVSPAADISTPEVPAPAPESFVEAPQSFEGAPAVLETAPAHMPEPATEPVETARQEIPTQQSSAPSTVEPPRTETVTTPASEFDSVAPVEEIRPEETEEAESLASPVTFLESAEIVAREIGRIPRVEANAAEPAPSEPVPIPTAAEPEVITAAPVAESIVEHAAETVIAQLSAPPESLPQAADNPPEPGPSVAVSPAPTESASAAPAQPAHAQPNVDEVVARVLEKLGPQLQELLATSLVRPLVEGLMQKPENEKK